MESKEKETGEDKKPCHCPLCNGELRSKKTIKKHLEDLWRKQVGSKENDEDVSTSYYAEASFVAGPMTTSQSMLQSGNPFVSRSGISHSDNDSDSDDSIISVFHSEHSQNDSPPASDVDDYQSDPEFHEPVDVGDEKITDFVLRTLLSKINYGWSQEETMTQIRNFYEVLNDDRIPHKNWQSVIHFLKELGYQDPKHYKICCAANHVQLLDYNTPCPECDKDWSKCTDYYVLGIHLEDIFLDPATTEAHLAHWKERDEWFGGKPDDIYYKEIWHGQRFTDLSFFWDSETETLLPTLCPNCENILTTSEIRDAALPGNSPKDPVQLRCSECMHSFIHTPQFMKGNPLNQAFIFHEDGFNAFVKKSRGMATIQLCSACTYKDERSKGKYLNVYSFIPSCSLGEGIRHKMDPFLKPLMDEVVDLFINGKNVNIVNPIRIGDHIIAAGQHKVRLLLLLGTADIKAHGELTLYAGGGKVGCRKCLNVGVYVPERRHYYYVNFRQRHRHPAALRTAEYQLEHGTAIENAQNQTERQNLQRESGVSGVTILFTLHKLYGFDPVNDMVIDRMHLCFNLLRKEFIDKIWPDVGDNADVPVNERTPAAGGLVNRGDFGKALEAVQWTREEKARGVARLKSLTDKLGSWKSDEFVKFSSVAREVLAERMPSKAYDSYILACSITQMLYSTKLRNFGWNQINISRLKGLTWSHAIAAEDYYGPDFCSENLEYSTHIAAEIERHSSPDNYSCELYERAIRSHKLQKNNAKGLEKTFAERENIRHFLQAYQQKNGPLCKYDNGKNTFTFDEGLLARAVPFYLNESSITAASALINQFSNSESPRMCHAMKNGVAVGKIKQQLFDDHQITDIGRYLKSKYPALDIEVPSFLQSINSVIIKDQFGMIVKLAKGDTCIIRGGGNREEEWIMELDCIIQAGPVDGRFFSFVNGKYYIPGLLHGNVVRHTWTLSPKLLPHTYTRDSVQPIANFKRKVIIYPDPSSLDDPKYFLSIDLYNPEVCKEVTVPLFPEDGDTVKVRGTRNDTWYGYVCEVDIQTRTLKVKWYQETRRQDIWSLTLQVDRIHFASLLGMVQVRRVFGGVRFIEAV